MSLRMRVLFLLLFALAVMMLIASNRVLASGPAQKPAAVQVVIPDEDRFSPFAMTVQVGTTVTWVNNDTDDHTLVSDDAFNTAGHFGTNILIRANGGKVSLTFRHPGVFPITAGSTRCSMASISPLHRVRMAEFRPRTGISEPQ